MPRKQKTKSEINEYVRHWRINNPEKAREYADRWRAKNQEKVKISRRLWEIKNQEKRKEGWRQWRINNPQKIKETKRKSYINHSEEVKECVNRWRKENPERRRKTAREEAKKRRNTPKGKLNNCISRAIHHSLKQGLKAGRHWEDLVGYTINQLKKHLEKRFTPEMSWQNHGIFWHIDHKVPIVAFNFEKPDDIDFRICWSLKNLQPLESKKNMSKGAKIKEPFQPCLAIG